MKRNTLARLAVALCAAVALMLTGCGGDDGVNQGLHDDLQMNHDELMAALEAEKAKVADLTAQIGSADDADSLMGMLATAQGNVTMYMDMATELQTTLGDETNPDAESVRGMLATANDNLATAQGNVTMYMDMATELQTTLGDETNPAAESVRGMLATANDNLATAQGNVTMYMDMATELQTTLGDETNPAAESVRGMLATANDNLATAQGNVTMYMDMATELQTTLGDETNPDAESVRGMLATANDNFGHCARQRDDVHGYGHRTANDARRRNQSCCGKRQGYVGCREHAHRFGGRRG